MPEAVPVQTVVQKWVDMPEKMVALAVVRQECPEQMEIRR